MFMIFTEFSIWNTSTVSRKTHLFCFLPSTNMHFQNKLHWWRPKTMKFPSEVVFSRALPITCYTFFIIVSSYLFNIFTWIAAMQNSGFAISATLAKFQLNVICTKMKCIWVIVRTERNCTKIYFSNKLFDTTTFM